LVILLFALCSGAILFGKRPPRKPVPPVTQNGVTYSASGDGFEEFVIATDESSKSEVWRVSVYKVPVKPELEVDVQAVFIKQLKLKDGALFVKDEAGRCYRVDLKKRTAQGVRCSGMSEASSSPSSK